MYQSLRSSGAISYDKVEQMFEEHQGKWPEAVFNEDSMFKYIDPLIEDGTGTYLSMLQGSKAEQRKWWLYNRFKYLDSKYNAGDAASDVIQIRGYAKSDVTVTPYADVYATVKYGSYLQQTRATRNVPCTLECPLDNVNDTEIYIYSASQLASVGDLSGFKVGLADFSKATRLQEVKVGDADPEYANENLGAGRNTFTFGNNVLLKKIDARNCISLGKGEQKSVDISHCTNIEEVYFDGTAIQGISLPNGGVLKKLHLPDSITNLTIMNQTGIQEVVIPSLENVTTVRLENVGGAFDMRTLITEIPANTRLRLIGFHWECNDSDEIDEIIDVLNTMRGLDEYGNTMETAQVSGSIHVPSLTGDKMAYYNEHYPYLNITADHTTAVLRYYNHDGTVLVYQETINDGGNGTYMESYQREADAQYIYTFAGWSRSQDSTVADNDAKLNVVADRNIYAAYRTTVQKYTVVFKNGSTVLQTNTNVPYGSSVSYTGTTPTYSGSEEGDFVFTGWDPDPSFIAGNTECMAVFVDTSTPLSRYLLGTMTEYESDTDESMYYYSFYGNQNLESVITDATDILTTFGNGNNLTSATNLTYIEMTNEGQLTFGDGPFPPNLKALVLHTNYVPVFISASNSTNASYTPWESSGLATLKGAIYVKSSLVDLMRMDARFGKFQILDIEDYSDERTDFSSIQDSWAEIISSVNNGTYLSDYQIGDTKILEINGNTYYMELIAFDTDELSDGTGFAHTTWLSKGYSEYKAMNSTATNVGGWLSSELRTYVRGTMLSSIDSTVRSAIKSVKKTSYDNGTTVTSDETLWIPSLGELCGNDFKVGSMMTAESSGVEYAGKQATATISRFRAKYSSTTGKASAWTYYWFRSTYNANVGYFCKNSGTNPAGGDSATTENGVLLGFCI